MDVVIFLLSMWAGICASLGIIFLKDFIISKEKKKDICVLVVGMISVACAIVLFGVVWGFIYPDWNMNEQAYLTEMAEDTYLQEYGDTYIYQEKTPDSEPELLKVDKITRVEVQPIASDEEAYMQKYTKGLMNTKYVFYIPEDV